MSFRIVWVAQIGLFDGVRDAKVTIAEGGTQKYALDDTQQTDASASIVVTMDPGQDLTDAKQLLLKSPDRQGCKRNEFYQCFLYLMPLP